MNVIIQYYEFNTFIAMILIFNKIFICLYQTHVNNYAMLKNSFYICLFLLFCNTSEAQNLSSIIDSCHYYLDKQDTMSFNKIYIRILDAYEKEYDAELYSVGKELEEMRIEDQSIRLLLMDASKKKRNVDKIRRIMDDIDRRNAVRVTEIIDQYGWLSPDEIGYEANEALFLCILHIPADTRSAFPVISVHSPVSIQCRWQS